MKFDIVAISHKCYFNSFAKIVGYPEDLSDTFTHHDLICSLHVKVLRHLNTSGLQTSTWPSCSPGYAIIYNVTNVLLFLMEFPPTVRKKIK